MKEDLKRHEGKIALFIIISILVLISCSSIFSSCSASIKKHDQKVAKEKKIEETFLSDCIKIGIPVDAYTTQESGWLNINRIYRTDAPTNSSKLCLKDNKLIRYLSEDYQVVEIPNLPDGDKK